VAGRIGQYRSRESVVVVELCIHVANIFYLASFLVRDIFWLRIFTCIGLVLGVIFFTCQANPLYGPTVWHVLFLVINALQIWRLIIERRKRMLPVEQQRIAEKAFRDLSRDQLLTLLTRSMCDRPDRIRDLEQVVRKPLSDDEQLVRDLAFSHLSRKDLLNLLTRRLWQFLKKLNPVNWGQPTVSKPRSDPPVATGAGNTQTAA
jgi:Popeye protein conserved region